jgi:hypothetical protein
MRDLDCAN